VQSWVGLYHGTCQFCSNARACSRSAFHTVVTWAVKSVPSLAHHVYVCHMTLLLGMQVSRPDGKPDLLGLKVLDEPAAVQSDPSLLTMQLRQASKQASPLVPPL